MPIIARCVKHVLCISLGSYAALCLILYYVDKAQRLHTTPCVESHVYAATVVGKGIFPSLSSVRISLFYIHTCAHIQHTARDRGEKPAQYGKHK